jgi:hypothetical protein
MADSCDCECLYQLKSSRLGSKPREHLVLLFSCEEHSPGIFTRTQSLVATVKIQLDSTFVPGIMNYSLDLVVSILTNSFTAYTTPQVTPRTIDIHEPKTILVTGMYTATNICPARISRCSCQGAVQIKYYLLASSYRGLISTLPENSSKLLPEEFQRHDQTLCRIREVSCTIS